MYQSCTANYDKRDRGTESRSPGSQTDLWIGLQRFGLDPVEFAPVEFTDALHAFFRN